MKLLMSSPMSPNEDLIIVLAVPEMESKSVNQKSPDRHWLGNFPDSSLPYYRANNLCRNQSAFLHSITSSFLFPSAYKSSWFCTGPQSSYLSVWMLPDSSQFLLKLLNFLICPSLFLTPSSVCLQEIKPASVNELDQTKGLPPTKTPKVCHIEQVPHKLEGNKALLSPKVISSSLKTFGELL